MRRALCETLDPSRNALVEIPEAEAKHLTSVLRLGPGDGVELLDGSGNFAEASLQFRDKRLFASLTGPVRTDPKRLSLPLHLKVAILKGEAMEWVVEKAVELGVRTLTPIETEFTVVKIHKKGAETFLERWQKIADQSLKQCGRLDRMRIRPPESLDQVTLDPSLLYWLDESLAAEAKGTEHLSRVLRAEVAGPGVERALLVGPEGGLSSSEKGRLLQLTVSGKKAIKRVHLGSLILRAETAALLGISLLAGEDYGKDQNPI